MSSHQYYKSVVFITILFLTGCQGFQFDPWPENGEGIYHTVQKGQTLYRIAIAYDLDVDVLRRSNHIGDPKKLKEGIRLWIPGARRVLSLPPTEKSAFRTAKKKIAPDCHTPKGFSNLAY